jgi:MFS family permease
MPSDVPTSKSARRALWLAGLGHGMAHSWDLIFPAVAVPIASELGLPYAQVVTLSFLSYLLFGLGALPSGWAADRFGSRPVLLVCLAGGGLSGSLVALSSDSTVLVLSLGGLGLAASLYHPAGLALLSRQFPGGMGRAFAINGIAGNVGIALTPLLSGLAASLLGWRWAYVLLCLPALVAAAILWLLPFPEHARGHDQAEPTHTTRRQPSVRIAPLVLMGCVVICAGLSYRLHSLVLPALIQDRMPSLATWVAAHTPSFMKHVENLAATALVTLAYALGMLGHLWGGRVADRRVLAPAYLSFHAAGLPFVVLAAFVGGPMLLPLLVGYMFFNQGMQPIENSLVAALVPPRWRGRVFSGKFVLAFGFGSLGVWLVALVVPHYGLGGALALAAGFEVVLIGASFAIWRLLPTARSSEAGTFASQRT